MQQKWFKSSLFILATNRLTRSDTILSAGVDASLLLHADGTDGSTSFPDAAGRHTVTACGNAQVDTAQKVFGDGSVLFAAATDYLSLPDSEDWNFGSGNFTVDFRVRFASVGDAMFFNQSPDGSNVQQLYFQPSNGIHFCAYVSGSWTLLFRCAWTPSTDTWYHIALVRNGNSWSIYIDGVAQTLILMNGSYSVAMPSFSAPLFIGSNTDSYFVNGWIDEFRIVKGTACWTENFTPPSEAYALPEVMSTSFAYDGNGNRTALTDAKGQSTYYNYDALNRLTAISDALEQTEYYAYDAVSNLSASTSAEGLTTYFAYDALHRQTMIDYPIDASSLYGYDANGNVVSATGESGTSYFAYDAVNRLTRETPPTGCATNHGYDAASRRISLGYAGTQAYYEYDAAGRETRAEGALLGYGRQAFGQTPYGGGSSMGATYYMYDATSNLISKRWGNNAYSTFEYDAANRITKIDNRLPNNVTCTYFAFDYDAASRITSIQREAGLSTYYAYDNANRLTGETWQNAIGESIYAFQWDYDYVGNRTFEMRNGALTYYSYNGANELLQTHAIPADTHTYYQYDPRGNCTRIAEPDGTTYFTYNDADLVKSILFKDGTPNYFHYDAMLRRYAMQDSTGLSYFTWDSNGLNLLAESDSYGNVTAEYMHGYTPIDGIGNMLAAKKYVGSTACFQYPQYDHRGTVQALTDQVGTQQASYLYDAWGQPLSTQESAITQAATNRFRYQSNWLIIKEGICKSPARLYNLKVCTYLQVDPLANLTDQKKYAIFTNTIFLQNTTIGLSNMKRRHLQNIILRNYIYASNKPCKNIDAFGLYDYPIPYDGESIDDYLARVYKDTSIFPGQKSMNEIMNYYYSYQGPRLGVSPVQEQKTRSTTLSSTCDCNSCLCTPRKWLKKSMQ